ncbi:MAG: cation:proton antiporter [Capsulimonas sp.]|uniref:cation:proton antiporter domain-containing protein n=1 Tax=Capsulimonas sp. TaxID=2494211 RepID=UPI0032653ECC
MAVLSADSFASILALVGVVIIVAALMSGFIERSNVPQVAVFLGLGAVLGPAGLHLLDVHLNSQILRVVATLSLALVLFTDAVSLNVPEVRKQTSLALRVLGPGTLLSATLIGLAAWGLLNLPPAACVLLGAALASTDPVLLRGLLRRPDIPSAARQALRLESGLNDVVLLPIVLVALPFLMAGPLPNVALWIHMGLNLFLLGPVAGIAVGLVGVAVLDLVRRRVGIRRDYESLYSLGVAFAAFAAAETVHGSGFLAVFAAGLTIAALDVELCDCFLEYGETTAELALLFTFVLLGSSLIWSGFAMLSVATLAFAALTLLSRPVAFAVALAGTKLGKKAHTLISWFGPRGLSTLLLVLLPVFAGVPGSERLFSICCLVVVMSVILHGGSLMLVRQKSQTEPAAEPSPAEVAPAHEPAPTIAQDFVLASSVSVPTPRHRDGARDGGHTGDRTIASGESIDRILPAVPAPIEGAAPPAGDRITVAEMQRLQDAGQHVVILDVRSERTFNDSDLLATGVTRIDYHHAAEYAAKTGIPKDAWIILFCACPDDKTSVYTAGEMRKAGWTRTYALRDGWDAWREAGLPVTAKAGV